MSGCRSKALHVASPITTGVHRLFSDPEATAEWVKSCIVELVQSVESDLAASRYFAYFTRWRVPEELYHRALYVLFVANDPELPHIASGELPNGFSDIWKRVNQAVFDGKGTLDQKQMGLSGEEFTAMGTLNSAAHASFAAIVTCIDLSKNRDKWKPTIDRHITHWKQLCVNLNFIAKGFKAGKNRAQVLTEFKQLHKAARSAYA